MLRTKWSELGVDVGGAGAFADAGDLPLSHSRGEVAGNFAEIACGFGVAGKSRAAGPRRRSFSSVAHPESVCATLSRAHDHPFDAHPDLYNEFDGSRVSHARPFMRIMEERLAKRLVQIGIRTWDRHQREQAERFGVEIVPVSALPAHGRLKLRGPICISFDTDVLDPAFAPGISHRDPGGMTCGKRSHTCTRLRELLLRPISLSSTLCKWDARFDRFLLCQTVMSSSFSGRSFMTFS